MTTIQITCPSCHTRCQLKGEAGKSLASRGKCPECGHIFPIPPGLKESGENGAGTSEISDRHRYRRFLPAGLVLLFLAGAGLLFALSPHPVPKPPATTTATTPTPPATAIPLSLDPEIRSETLARIRQHALVGDAGIRLEHDRYRLSLLVSRNTPPTYAEELGRQFAFYLERRLQQKAAPVFPIEVSVYYPGGTRLEVARHQHDGEEEVLPQEEAYETAEKPENKLDNGESVRETAPPETGGGEENSVSPTTGNKPDVTQD